MVSVFREVMRTEEILRSNSETSELRMSLFNSVKKFVLGGEYTSYKNKEVFLSYAFYKDSVIAKKLGISEAGVRRVRARLSEQAYRMIGVSTLDTILGGTESDLLALKPYIDSLSNKTTSGSLFSGEILELIDYLCLDSTVNFNLEDCAVEMSMLRLFSFPLIKEAFSRIDIEKLNYLIRVLNGETGDLKTRSIVSQALSSNDTGIIPRSLRDEFVTLPSRGNGVIY